MLLHDTLEANATSEDLVEKGVRRRRPKKNTDMQRTLSKGGKREGKKERENKSYRGQNGGG